MQWSWFLRIYFDNLRTFFCFCFCFPFFFKLQHMIYNLFQTCQIVVCCCQKYLRNLTIIFKVSNKLYMLNQNFIWKIHKWRPYSLHSYWEILKFSLRIAKYFPDFELCIRIFWAYPNKIKLKIISFLKILINMAYCMQRIHSFLQFYYVQLWYFLLSIYKPLFNSKYANYKNAARIHKTLKNT